MQKLKMSTTKRPAIQCSRLEIKITGPAPVIGRGSYAKVCANAQELLRGQANVDIDSIWSSRVPLKPRFGFTSSSSSAVDRCDEQRHRTYVSTTTACRTRAVMSVHWLRDHMGQLTHVSCASPCIPRLGPWST